MKRAWRPALALLLGASTVIAGCAGGGMKQTTPVPPPSVPVMQMGQWEFVLPGAAIGTPSNFYIEANFQDSTENGMGPFSTAANTTSWIVGGQNGCPVTTTGSVAVTNSGNMLNLIINESAQVGIIAGTLSTTQTLINGTYQGSWPVSGLNTSITGYAVSPLDGTFSGTLVDTAGNSYSVSLLIAQSGFNVTATGSNIGNGNSLSLSVLPNDGNDNGACNEVIGAALYANGTATGINGSEGIIVTGHFDAAATQIDIAIVLPATTETGTLNKQ